MHSHSAILPATRTLLGRRSSLSLTTRVANIKHCVPAVQSLRSINTAVRFIPRLATFSSPVSIIPQGRRHYAATPEAVENSDREDLYYHEVGDNVFAISFLPEKPRNPESPTVIGLIPGDKGLDSFQENQPFVDLLHDTIKAALIEGADEELINDAKRRQEGWLHIQDWRHFPEMGRVGSPDDILGSVLVQDGKIKGETYQRMPSYRTCTTDGPLKLSPSLQDRLLKSLREAHQKESKA